jgi:glycerol uptake facilitator-like aquaporin
MSHRSAPRRVPGYVVAQMVGGLAAAVFLRTLFGTAGALGATVPGSGTALAMEVVLTAGLVNTILGTASGARNIGTDGAIAVGGYIALAGLWAAPISGLAVLLLPLKTASAVVRRSKAITYPLVHFTPAHLTNSADSPGNSR